MESQAHGAQTALSGDTDARSEWLQVTRWRTMRPEEKLRLVADLNETVDAIAIAGIRQRHPAASPREQFLRLASLKLGRDLAERAYPDAARLGEP